jgi:hypothetical protein
MITVQEEEDAPYPPRWFVQGSKFFKELDEALRSSGSKYVIDALLWSGANSVFERDRAANELAIRLTSVHEQNREIESVVIAHSHGGNIAMRAAHYLYKSNVKFRIVTLATPFVRVDTRKEQNDPSMMKLYIRVMLSLGSVSAGITAVLLSMVAPMFSESLPPTIIVAMGVLICMCAAFILIPLILTRLLGIDAWRRRAIELAAATVYPIATSAITKLLAGC